MIFNIYIYICLGYNINIIIYIDLQKIRYIIYIYTIYYIYGWDNIINYYYLNKYVTFFLFIGDSMAIKRYIINK